MRDPNHRTKNYRRKELMIDGVPAELRTALVSCAKDHDLSVNETAVRILANHYKVKVQPAENGLRGQKDRATHSFPRADTDKLSIRGPASLHRKIDADARRRGGTLRGVVLECLSLNFGLEPESIERRPRKKGTK
jgi:hypothetical protein